MIEADIGEENEELSKKTFSILSSLAADNVAFVGQDRNIFRPGMHWIGMSRKLAYPVLSRNITICCLISDKFPCRFLPKQS